LALIAWPFSRGSDGHAAVTATTSAVVGAASIVNTQAFRAQIALLAR
jgi:hypothetical protein